MYTYHWICNILHYMLINLSSVYLHFHYISVIIIIRYHSISIIAVDPEYIQGTLDAEQGNTP